MSSDVSLVVIKPTKLTALKLYYNIYTNLDQRINAVFLFYQKIKVMY